MFAFSTKVHMDRQDVKKDFYVYDGLLPLDSRGTGLLPKIPTREFVASYFKEKQIDEETLREHLFDLLQNVL